MRLPSLMLLALAAACGDSSTPDAKGDGPAGVPQADGGAVDASTFDLPPGVADAAQSPGADLVGTVTSDGGGLVMKRPYHFHVPTGYDRTKATPLVILLHGYTATGDLQESYFKLTPVSDAHTFLYAYPDGLVDQGGNHYWNATDACCDIYGTHVDDVAYLNAVIDDMEQKFNVDSKRVYFVGHSNGAFMSHRMACEASSRVAAVVALAGDNWKDYAQQCKPTVPVSVLQVHGDLDAVIAYNGGINYGHMYPSAHDSVKSWAALDACTGPIAATGKSYDLDGTIAGNETTVEAYGACPAGTDVQLWTMHGDSHIPNFNSSWGETIYAFLSAHSKP